jgi:hypothetical protein
MVYGIFEQKPTVMTRERVMTHTFMARAIVSVIFLTMHSVWSADGKAITSENVIGLWQSDAKFLVGDMKSAVAGHTKMVNAMTKGFGAPTYKAPKPGDMVYGLLKEGLQTTVIRFSQVGKGTWTMKISSKTDGTTVINTYGLKAMKREDSTVTFLVQTLNGKTDTLNHLAKTAGKKAFSVSVKTLGAGKLLLDGYMGKHEAQLHLVRRKRKR